MNRKERTKPRRHKGGISPKDRLDVYWRRNKRNLSPKELIYIVLTIEYQLIKKRALIEFLTRKNLNFNLFDRMLNAAKEILEKNKKIKTQFLKQCFDICTANNLVELGEVAVSEAIKELFQRIETGSISNRISLQALIRFFKKTTNEKARMNLWEKIVKLDPDESDSKELLDLIYGKYAFYKITSKIEKYIREKAKKKNKKTLVKIEGFVEQIKKGQK